MSFGKKIRQIRLQQGLTQVQVAKALGHESSSYVSDVEIGKFIPASDKLERLAHALGVTNEVMNDLLLEERLETLGLGDPAFTMMFKEIPHMTQEEKQSLIRAYEAVIRARGQKRQHEKSDSNGGGNLH